MSNNIMEEYINFSKKCIHKYIKKIMDRQFDSDIFDDLIKTYIDARYYNIYEQKYKTFETNISYYLLKTTLELLKNEKEEQKIKIMFSIFEYILYFDNVMECDSAKKVIKKLNDFRMDKLKINEENFVEEFFQMIKEDLTRKKEFIQNLECKDFTVNYDKTNQHNVYDTTIEYELKFPKIYSKYSIDKAFKSKEINEQKLFVIYPNVTSKIVNDVIKGQFKKTYLVDYNINLHEKPKKLKRLYNLIDNDIVKEKLIIKIDFKDFTKYKEEIYEYMRSGFRYAISIDKSFEITVKNLEILQIFKYIILDKKSVFYQDFKDLENAIIVG